MNDLFNNITKVTNTKELFEQILKIVSAIYDKIVPNSVKNRKNKGNATTNSFQFCGRQSHIFTPGRKMQRCSSLDGKYVKTSSVHFCIRGKNACREKVSWKNG